MDLCLALDLPSREANLKLLNDIEHSQQKLDFWVKIGLRSFIRDGRDFLETIKNHFPQLKIFLDLKLYDIPNTTAQAAVELAQIGVDMITIHASSGKRVMQMVCESLKKLENPPLVFAVTALTSFSKEEFKSIYEADLECKALELAKMAYCSGVNGVVCSVWESLYIKKQVSPTLLTLTPAIRPSGKVFYTEKDDQQRVANIKEAKVQKSDFIVIGRPIYRADNPALAVKETLRQINSVNTHTDS